MAQLGGIMDYKARFYSPCIMQWIQPDTIIPDIASLQSWNRYSYTENNPVNYSDQPGHFKCKSNVASFDEDACQEAVESYLTLLEEQGGKEGKAMARAFRSADSHTYYAHNGLSATDEDLITITINGNMTAAASYGTDGSRDEKGELIYKDNNFSISNGMMHKPDETNMDDLVAVGEFGHEIEHLDQAHNPLRILAGASSGSLYGEIEAYDVQSKIYKNMGLDSGESGTVSLAAEVAGYRHKSARDVLTSCWATTPGYYDKYPLTH